MKVRGPLILLLLLAIGGIVRLTRPLSSSAAAAQSKIEARKAPPAESGRAEVPGPQQERHAGSVRGLAAAGRSARRRPRREDDGGGEGRADDPLVAGRLHRARTARCSACRPPGSAAAGPRRRAGGSVEPRVRGRREPEQRRADGQREPRAARHRAAHPLHPGAPERGRVAGHHREVPQRPAGDGGGQPPRHPDRVQHRPAARRHPWRRRSPAEPRSPGRRSRSGPTSWGSPSRAIRRRSASSARSRPRSCGRSASSACSGRWPTSITEPRWNRINGTFGEDADLVTAYTKAIVEGFQGKQLGPESVMTVTKHFPATAR